MSSALRQVIERASTDAAFRAELARNPDGALAQYRLTADERLGLLRGVVGALAPLGVDARATKLDTPCVPSDVFPNTLCS
ncbi:MAG TPA: hypothetical protein VFE37_14250 [Chloroflexota bacterium]|nr:hypothetical protein [Chloroflexota bacterium]